jgi:hypothetical protein
MYLEQYFGTIIYLKFNAFGFLAASDGAIFLQNTTVILEYFNIKE